MKAGFRSFTWALLLAFSVVSAAWKRDPLGQNATMSVPPARTETYTETYTETETETETDNHRVHDEITVPVEITPTTQTLIIPAIDPFNPDCTPIVVAGVTIPLGPDDCTKSDDRSNTVHLENKATGFELEFQPPVTIAGPSPSLGARPHVEITQDGWGTPGKPSITPTPLLHSKSFSAVLQTSIVVDGTTLVAGGKTATLDRGPTKTFLHVDPTGQIIIVAGTSTSSFVPPVLIGNKEATPLPSGLVIEQQTLSKGGPPITIGFGTTATTFSINSAGETIAVGIDRSIVVETPTVRPLVLGDTTASILASEFQYVVDSQTLAIDHAITIDEVIVSLKTADGATVLVAGTQSTTLAGARTADLSVVTRVVSGATEYIFGSQTLKPGHPITVADVPVSIETVSGHTILVVGSKTTTVGNAGPTGLSEEKGGTGAATSLSMWAAISFVAISVLGFA